MTNNYQSTPPNYAVSLVPAYKNYIAYNVTSDRCIVEIGSSKAEREIVIERSYSGWNIISDNSIDRDYSELQYPYYSYSNIVYGSQQSTSFNYSRISYMTSFIAVLMVGIVCYNCFVKMLRR